MGRRWYVVQTRARAEISAATRIAAIGFPTFLPFEQRMQRQGKWWVPVNAGPLFPRYIFAAFNRQKDDWGQILRDPLIPAYQILCDCRGQPCPVPYPVIRAIRRMNRPQVREKHGAKFSEGQEVRIKEGPFSSFCGLVEGSSSERVRVLLSLFGRETPVEMSESDLEAVSA